MKGSRGPTKQLHARNSGAFDHASHAPQLPVCNYIFALVIQCTVAIRCQLLTSKCGLASCCLWAAIKHSYVAVHYPVSAECPGKPDPCALLPTYVYGHVYMYTVHEYLPLPLLLLCCT